MGPISMYILKSQTCVAQTTLSFGDTNIFDDSSETKNSKLFPDINKCYLLLFIYVYNIFCLLVYVKTDNDTYSGKYALTMFTSTKFVITILIICIFSDNIVRVTSLLLHGVLVQAQ